MHGRIWRFSFLEIQGLWWAGASLRVCRVCVRCETFADLGFVQLHRGRDVVDAVVDGGADRLLRLAPELHHSELGLVIGAAAFSQQLTILNAEHTQIRIADHKVQTPIGCDNFALHAPRPTGDRLRIETKERQHSRWVILTLKYPGQPVRVRLLVGAACPLWRGLANEMKMAYPFVRSRLTKGFCARH